MASAPGRNDSCPCGSGKKYKHCCITKKHKQNEPIQQGQLQRALQLAQAHLRQGNLLQASNVCHKIIEVLPNQVDAWHLLGVIELRQGNIEVAIAHLTKAIKARPDHPGYLGDMAFALHEKGQLAEAELHYAKALRLAPSYSDVLYNQHALLLKKSREAAIENLERLTATNPRDLDAHFMLLVLLELEGRLNAASSHKIALEQGGKLDQARLDAWNYIKSTCSPLPPITGSMFETFTIAMAAAPKDGLVLEFGVRFGNTIRQLASLTEQKIYGFDSFEGLPEVWHHEPKGSYTTRGEIPKVPSHVQLIQGWFDQTLPEFLKHHEGPVRLLNVDCDIYSSTKTVLDELAPRIIPGSVIVFDEYIGNEHWREDEFKAFQESVARYKWKYEYLCFSTFTKQVVVRINSIG